LSLVEAFHAAFYTFSPSSDRGTLYWVAGLARRLTGLVRRLASLAHRSTGKAQSPFVGYPGYRLLLGKPDEYHAAQTSSARIQDVDVISI